MSPRRSPACASWNDCFTRSTVDFASGIGLPDALKGALVVTTDGGGVPPLPWSLGGLGVAGLGAGVFFTVSMFDEANGCKPKCTDSEISSIKTKNTLEIVSYAAGGALVVAAVVVAVVASRPSTTTQEAVWAQRLRVGVVPGGATGALHFSF